MIGKNTWLTIENRLLAVDDNGFVSNYWYDADGERTVKTSGESDQVYVNGIFSGGSTNTAKFSLYVSPYLVANQGGRYTKHIYAGSQRIVSKVGDFASYGSDPRRIEYAGANTDGLSVDYKSKYAAQQQVIKDNYKFFDVPYNGTDNDNYADGEGFCCNDGSMEAAVAEARKAQTRAVSRSFKDPDNYENLQFFYHPDHLGSSSFITNLDGEVVQHIEYVPFGEVFIEERNNVWNTPYLFNAKELDEETGMYYYGARYYDPRLSLWMSTDPLQEKYPNASSYAYASNSPARFIDINGCDWVERDVNGINEFYYDRQIKSQADINQKYGSKSGISYVHDGKSIDRGGNTYTFHNDAKNNKYGTVDMNGVRQDNSKIIYGQDYTIFGTSDNSCDASTLHGNLLGTSYTGGDNPKDYLGNDSYQYMPRNMSEYGSMIHDLMYDAAGAKGVDGALFDYRQEVIDADKKLVQYNMINVLISPSLKDKGRSALTVGAFGIIVGAKSAANAIDKTYNNAVDAYGRFTNAMKDAFSPSRWFK